MMRVALFFVCIFSLSFSPFAEGFAKEKGGSKKAKTNLTIDIAQDRVGITTNFPGAEVVVFGATTEVLRGAEIAAVLTGPETSTIVRKKQPVLGMWLNQTSVEFPHVPHFYAYAVSTNEQNMADSEVLNQQGIGINALHFEPADHDDLDISPVFQESLIRLLQFRGQYPLQAGQMQRLDEGLFRVNFKLPSNISTGIYTVRVFAFQKGKVVEKAEKIFVVEQVGISAEIRAFALNHSFMYAAVMLVMAIVMGLFSLWLSRRK